MSHQSFTTQDAALPAADQQGMDLLAAHVPLSLLLDLAEETPESQKILATERPDASELAWCAVS